MRILRFTPTQPHVSRKCNALLQNERNRFFVFGRRIGHQERNASTRIFWARGSIIIYASWKSVQKFHFTITI